jgi:hypothetical protein
MKGDISKSSQLTLLLGVVPAKSIDYHTRRDNTEHFGLNFGTQADRERERERETELANVKKFLSNKISQEFKGVRIGAHDIEGVCLQVIHFWCKVIQFIVIRCVAFLDTTDSVS